MITWLTRLLNRKYIRHGITANRGRIDRLGFLTAEAANDWALRAGLMNWVQFEYDVRERNLPSVHHASERP